MTPLFQSPPNPEALRAFVNDATRKTCIILFTPRSGSSRITDILSQTEKFGRPDEWFNPNFVPGNMAKFEVDNLDDYCLALAKRFRSGGVFGAELTYHQLRVVFETDAAFMARFRGASFVWLTRDDILSQAVSLHKMVVTKISHTTLVNLDAVGQMEQDYSYDSVEIKRWLEHILSAEEQTERLIAAYDLDPMRLSYEECNAMSELNLAAAFFQKMGLEMPSLPSLVSKHKKLATSKSRAFVARFREEEADYLRQVAERRRLARGVALAVG